jgi:hypothetical protein
MSAEEQDLIWAVRAFVYRHLADTAQPPSLDAIARRFGLAQEEAAAALRELDRRHALLLQRGSTAIHMAPPFSGVPTPFRVHALGRTYVANCAWDSLGIPAAMRCDAGIEAACAYSGEPVRLSVRDMQVVGDGALVHILVPFRRWYDDLVFT